jgi:hypothetical protein
MQRGSFCGLLHLSRQLAVLGGKALKDSRRCWKDCRGGQPRREAGVIAQRRGAGARQLVDAVELSIVSPELITVSI